MRHLSEKQTKKLSMSRMMNGIPAVRPTRIASANRNELLQSETVFVHQAICDLVTSASRKLAAQTGTGAEDVNHLESDTLD